jgi:predicted nucleotidyltransferase component of viral defense system
MILDQEGFDQDTLEKVYLISDVLQRISYAPFLRKRLSFTGGTALHFIVFPHVERLSVDLDFNFRHINNNDDWGKDRNEIDRNIKQIIYDLKYKPSDVRINASYPVTRFEVKYEKDSFRIEIGYMNRIPLFPTDQLKTFSHPKTGEPFNILSPQNEEIFSSKCAALLSRKTPRDLFDVALIATSDCDYSILRKAILLKNMMDKSYYLPNLDISFHLRGIRSDDRLKKVLRRVMMSPEKFETLKRKAISFLNQIRNGLTVNERECIRLFFHEHEFNLNLLGSKELFHPRIHEHPNILRTLQLMKTDNKISKQKIR